MGGRVRIDHVFERLADSRPQSLFGQLVYFPLQLVTAMRKPYDSFNKTSSFSVFESEKRKIELSKQDTWPMSSLVLERTPKISNIELDELH